LKAPDGRTLAKDLAEQFKVDVGDSRDLAKVSQVVELRKGRAELETYVKKRICGFEPDAVFRWICTIRWKAIYTTNYDDGIELAYGLTADPPHAPPAGR
jgi:hypothetical protein